ncbi:MAG TPA: permease [Candidatus Methanoperedens sp.]|nr:permease [Candidatus Methanoperedens sp.]
MINDLRIIGSLFLEQARDLWPFYLAGVLFAAFIKTFKWDRRIRASLVRYGKASIPIAVAAGLVSPLCSCGILPVVIALSAGGVPLPPVLALLITAPLMSPDAFLVTVGQLGWTFALWKLAIAATVGLSTGFAADALVRRGVLPASSFRVEKMYEEGGKVRPGFEEIVNAGCFSHAGEPGAVVDRESRLRFFLERSGDMAFLVGKYLVVALLIQAAVTYYLPVNMVEPLLGRKSALSVLFATLISVPLPLPQLAAPAVIKGLLASGMSPGAAMAMLVGGPVTSIPAMSALAGVYDRKAFLLYLGVGVTASLAAGYLFQLFHG